MFKKISLFVMALTVACFLLCNTMTAEMPLDPSAIEKSFLEWAQTAPRSDVSPLVAYLTKLKKDGMSDQDVEQAREILNHLFPTRIAVAEIVFDHIYSKSSAGFSTNPNALLTETIRHLHPGKALDVCMGQGRNAVFLAQMGWQVTGFDISNEGLKTAQAAAEKAGVQLRTVWSTSEAFDYGKDQWDLIVLSYALGPFRDPAYIARISASLRKKGLIVWEQYSDDESESTDSGPNTPNSLLHMFASFRILSYEYVMARADWSFEGPVQRIAKLVAQKMP